MSNVILSNLRRSDSRVSLRHAGSFPAESIEEVKVLATEEAPDSHPLIRALGEAAAGVNIFNSEKNSRRLIAAIGPKESPIIEGVMYAEGSGAENGPFSSANISIWIRRTGFLAGARHLHNSAVSEARRYDVRRRFYEVGLGNWDELHKELGVDQGSIFWGLPVKSDTLVTPIGNQEGDIQEPFFEGDWQDALAVSGLDIPNPLKHLVISSVLGYHSAQRLDRILESGELASSITAS